jgi:hypothetical protein
MEASSIRTFLPEELYTGGPAWRAAAEAGFDMSLIVTALRMPVAERLRMHDMALNTALSMRQAFIEQYGRTRETDCTTH